MKARVGIHREAAGISLLELLVALGCTSLLAAAVLPLVVGGGRLGRDRMERLDTGSAAAAAAAAVAADLARVGVGLEGAGAARRDGLVVPLVDLAPAGGVVALLTRGEAVEVAGVGPVGSYRAAGRGGLQPGMPVVALGSPGASGADPVPLGDVLGVGPGPSGDVRILVAFAAPEVAHLVSVGSPRALVPVSLREYGTAPDAATGLQRIWRRDDGGPRQPLVEGVTELRVAFYLDRDGDGVGEDGPRDTLAGATGGSGPAAELRAVRVSVSVARGAGELAAGSGRAATAWAGVGGPRR